MWQSTLRTWPVDYISACDWIKSATHGNVAFEDDSPQGPLTVVAVMVLLIITHNLRIAYGVFPVVTELHMIKCPLLDVHFSEHFTISRLTCFNPVCTPHPCWLKSGI